MGACIIFVYCCSGEYNGGVNHESWLEEGSKSWVKSIHFKIIMLPTSLTINNTNWLQSHHDLQVACLFMTSLMSIRMHHCHAFKLKETCFFRNLTLISFYSYTFMVGHYPKYDKKPIAGIGLHGHKSPESISFNFKL